MRSLVRPAVTARQALDLCTASIRDADLNKRLGLAGPSIEAAEAQYVANGAQATLYTIAGTNGVDGWVTTEEMERVYAGTFVKSVRTRNIYDSIKKLPENDICPLCGQRTVFTLDHYLPQSAHPALTITTANLVPSCGECNKTKLALQAAQAGDQTLHPYFDDVDDDRWLFATVQETQPAALVFSANPPAGWDHVKRQRAASHFRVFGLAQLYASHSAVELNNIRFGLQQMAVRNTPEEIQSHLRREALSRAAAQTNSWQRATYEAFAESEWFSAGGFG
jgi:hypothetical protein